MKLKKKQDGFSLLGMVIALIIGVIVIRQVMNLGSSTTHSAKAVSFISQIRQLNKDIQTDAEGKLNYAYLNPGNNIKDQTYLINRGMIPNDWKYDATNGWFVTPGLEVVNVINNVSNAPTGTQNLNNGFTIVINNVNGKNFMEYLKSFPKEFYYVIYDIDGYPFYLSSNYSDPSRGNMTAAFAQAAEQSANNPNANYKILLLSI